ncbi:Prefoldin [Hyaloraphidium curvatum]|nr:Prefoldin [Hyaloraphidium curvatum]
MALVMSNTVPPAQRQEVAMKFQQLTAEVEGLRKELMRLDSDKEEHQLVVDTITELNADRTCYRLVNGVLMERTVGELLPQLKDSIEKMTKRLDDLMEGFKKRQTELDSHVRQYGIKQAPQG